MKRLFAGARSLLVPLLLTTLTPLMHSAAQAQTNTASTTDICDRSQHVRTEILKRIGGDPPCSAADLSRANDTIDLFHYNLNDHPLQEGDFAGLTEVRTIWLHQKNLESLPAGLFHGMESLTNLYMADNRLSRLDADMFRGLGNLRVLGLDRNRIEVMAEGAFDGLGNLRELFLADNLVSTTSATIFRDLENLTLLGLDRNRIETLHTGMFATLGKLEKLYLNGNRIVDLPPGVFQGLDVNEFNITHTTSTTLLQLEASLSTNDAGDAAVLSIREGVPRPVSLTISISAIGDGATPVSSTITSPAGQTEHVLPRERLDELSGLASEPTLKIEMREQTQRFQSAGYEVVVNGTWTRWVPPPAPDVNDDNAVDANDALILYYAYSLRSSLGTGR